MAESESRCPLSGASCQPPAESVVLVMAPLPISSVLCLSLFSVCLLESSLSVGFTFSVWSLSLSEVCL